MLATTTCDTPTNGSLVGAPTDLNGYFCAGSAQSGGERVYSLVAPTTGDITIDLTNLTSDTDLFVMRSDNGCDPDDCVGASENAGNAAEQIVLNAAGGRTYYIAVEDWSGGASSFTLQATCVGGGSFKFADDFEGGDATGWDVWEGLSRR